MACGCGGDSNTTIEMTGTHTKTKLEAERPVQVELFVMSMCPYSLEAEQAVISLAKELAGKVDLKISYIAREKAGASLQSGTDAEHMWVDGTTESARLCDSDAPAGIAGFQSLHGAEEVEEDIRQLIIGKYHPQQYLDYVLARTDLESDWRDIALELGMDVEWIGARTSSDEGTELLARDVRRAEGLGISASPTIVVDGRRYVGWAGAETVRQTVCAKLAHCEACAGIPRCTSDRDCFAPGKEGTCVSAGTADAHCEFFEPQPFQFTVIGTDACPHCETDRVTRATLERFPGAQLRTVSAESDAGAALVNKHAIERLPAYIYDEGVTRSRRFDEKVERTLRRSHDKFVLDPAVARSPYFLSREEVPGRLGLFTGALSATGREAQLRLTDIGTPFDVHFVVRELPVMVSLHPSRDDDSTLHIGPLPTKRRFTSVHGDTEVQENLRQSCMATQHSDQYPAYLRMFHAAPDVARWREYARDAGMDVDAVEQCASSDEAGNRLAKDAEMVSELNVNWVPSYLLDNRVLVAQVGPDEAVRVFMEEHPEVRTAK